MITRKRRVTATRVIVVLILACVTVSVVFFANTTSPTYVSEFVIPDIRDPAKSSIFGDINTADISSVRNQCAKAISEYELLKLAWPAQAQPGDVGYRGAGMVINVTLLSESEKKIYDSGKESYKVNQLVSDRLPLRRNIVLDMPECSNLTYDTTNLPTAGIVLIFTDEMWSALMRTVFSILDAGPEHLINEIILVDDASQKDHLGKPLDDYIKIFGGKVKVVRLPERKGLIVARMTGFEHVTGEVAVFLDAHCEVHKGWLEPLLHRIKENDAVVAVPNTDVLDWDTFKYIFTPSRDHHRCGFEFNMVYKWIPIPKPDGVKRKTDADPLETAIHMGCCFATSKRNFQRLGGYDSGLEIWGCENLELSFMTWMCGGRLEVIPCSHIAHMYRPSFPYQWVGKPHIFERNCLRVAEVWMDQYKIFYQDRISHLMNKIDIGDVSQRKALRENLKCHSFDWYIKEIYPDIYLPLNTTALGKISSMQKSSMCIDIGFHKAVKGEHIKTGECHPEYHNQYFYLTKEKQIRRDSDCLSYDPSNGYFIFPSCDKDKGQWEYTQNNQIVFTGTNHCITLDNDNTIFMSECKEYETSQQWNWPRRSLTLS